MPPHSRTKIVAVVLVAIATTLALASSWSDSLVVDEVPHIGAGYSYVTHQDYRLNPEHPPLAKDIAGIPLLFLGLNNQAFTQRPWTVDINGQWNFGRSLIFGSGNDPDAITFLARLPVLLFFFLIACYFIWRWSSELYGQTAALIATTLFAFSPTILAHARLVTTDVPAATGVLVATYFFMRFLRAPGRGTFALSALTLGLALLCKFNTALLVPYFVIVACMYHRSLKEIGIAALLIATAFIGVVWPVYILQTWHQPVANQLTETTALLASQHGPLKAITFWLVEKPVLRALGHWMLGFAMVAQRSVGGSTIYWLGRVVPNGGPWYFPLVYLLKEPLPWLILIALAFVAIRRKKYVFEEGMWLVWLAIYWGVSMYSTLNIGIRHLLPVYPFTIMLVAGRVSLLRGKYVRVLVGLLLGWYIFESVSVFPYYLTYFNQFAGGPAGGYRYVVDSNLDWGQDLKRLGVWARDEHLSRLTLDYFGWADPAYYLKDRYIWSNANQFTGARDFITRNRSNGWLAVSATFLQNNSVDKYRWLQDYQPVAVIGHSIFVFHITQ